MKAREKEGFQFIKTTSRDVERHVPLLRRIIKLYDFGSVLDYDEKFAAGLVGIAIALERYDPNKNPSLACWIAYRVKREIQSEARKNRLQLRFYSQPQDEEERFDVPEEPKPTERELQELDDQKAEDIELVREIMRTLPQREREVLVKIYLEGKTQREVGQELGCAQSWVSRIAKSAEAKVRRECARRRATQREN
ncbi:MAG: sigma-70 family RNA polymerase sigma factor [Thermoguttaceae bacterium]|nr:sigma-70 family RNA polymerase sigma factor [Thermoguttaceae bacterium]